jgi:hypothetical protein
VKRQRSGLDDMIPPVLGSRCKTPPVMMRRQALKLMWTRVILWRVMAKKLTLMTGYALLTNG